MKIWQRYLVVLQTRNPRKWMYYYHLGMDK